MMNQFYALFKIQRELDQTIEEKHGLTDQNLVPYKLLAFQVELGELANETRCFKFWSKKPASSREVILEEYVDGLHFLMSLGLDSHYEINASFWQQVEDIKTIQEVELAQHITNNERQTAAFQAVFKELAYFGEKESLDCYLRLFTSFLSLGKVLGFNLEEMVEAYLEKNKINYVRQEQGY